MRFLDRKEELKRLDRLADEVHGGFAAVWGRRRIGKSALLMEWCRRHDGLYTVADRTLAPLQRESFAVALSVRFSGFADAVYPSWKSLFSSLSIRAEAENWHGPLVLDEFPYWVESDETVPSILQNWIDSEKARGGIVCAIAGSIQHMMQGLVMDSDSPLYGRADEKFRLEPIGVQYIAEGLKLKSAVDSIKAYAAWGGVPRYWVAAERYGENIENALDELVLDPLGVFHDEPASLLQSEIPNAIGLKPYLDAIGLGANRVSEIAGRLGQPATALARPLARLVEMGLVKREIPFGVSGKDGKRSLYKVCDPFCRLWFKVLAGRKSAFDNSPRATRTAIWRGFADALFGETWENLSRESVASSLRLANLAGAGGYWLPAGRWWQANAPEWDIVSVNGGGDKALLGEAKWSSRPFKRRDVLRLASQLQLREPPPGMPEKTQRVLYLSAVERNAFPNGRCGDVEIVTAGDVVSGR